MKCDELKSYTCGGWCCDKEAYPKKDVDEAIAELKARIHEIESMPHTDNSAVIGLLSDELEKLRPMEAALEIAESDNKKYIERIKELEAENEKLSNALDKERSETIKYMDELCNAKNEIERLTIDKRNAELRADAADATVEKLKANKQNLEDLVAYFQNKASNFQLMSDIRRVRIKEKSRALWLARAARAKTEYQHWILIWRCANTNQYFFINKTRYKHTSKVDRMRYPWEWRDIWSEVEKRCLKKAKEYK